VADEWSQVSGATGAPPTRRALLIASAAALPVLLTACKGIQALGTPPAPPTDVDVLRTAIAHEAELVASYSAVLSGSVAGLRAAAALVTVLNEHRLHLEQLKSRLIEPAGLKSPAATRSSAPATPPGGRSGGAVLTMAQLEAAEQAASDRLIAQLDHLPPTLAQLFASIAASEATHVPLLRAAGQGR
jgi:hypothetical protein